MKKVSDEKKCVICLALVIIMGLLLFYTYIGDSGNNHEGIVRLHVIANSDTVGDQALKLKVRDAVIEYMQKQDDLASAEDTEKFLRGNLDRLEKIAGGVIASEGYDYPVDADIGIRYIPEKTYGDITFPAGNYEALNITIGSGEGENWWCVLFPPLCLLDEGTEEAGSGQSGGQLTGDELAGDELTVNESDEHQPTDDRLTDDRLTDQQRLELRWKLIELLEDE